MEQRLPEKSVREFQMIVWDEFQMNLNYDEAEQRAVEVLELFWLLFEDPDQSSVPPPAHPSVSPKEQGQLF